MNYEEDWPSPITQYRTWPKVGSTLKVITIIGNTHQEIGISGFDPALRNVREAGRREAESRSSAENVAAERTVQHNGVNYNVMHGRFCEIYHFWMVWVWKRVFLMVYAYFQIIKMIAKELHRGK
ncbi:hypothetical protein CEXT_574271 [Caerostris extrusa]|uniref:Uncharacterized protein n=1 Tax=Caerostris extrusa TaxID=172846 RepID=A0AAV4PEP3_CAEEX|nr:hypothetical protein CEXT_574271 [Caerostris extrusa]